VFLLCSESKTALFSVVFPQRRPDHVLDGRRPPVASVSGAVRGGRDRVARLPPRPGLTGAVLRRTPPFRRRAAVDVPADGQHLRDHQHDHVHHARTQSALAGHR